MSAVSDQVILIYTVETEPGALAVVSFGHHLLFPRVEEVVHVLPSAARQKTCHLWDSVVRYESERLVGPVAVDLCV
jgi:hypothetical protein